MPELPEVEVVRAGLEPAVRGARIEGVEVFEARSLKRHDGAAAAFEAALLGRTIRSAARRGKFLWLPLEPIGEPDAVLAHLGMSGQLLLRAADAPADRHLRVRIALDGPAGQVAVVFADQRIFGSLAVDRLVPTPDGAAGGLGDAAALVPTQVTHIARDPLDPAFRQSGVIAALRGRRTTVKRALLDQTLLSGIGNIYADEALWAAKVHPEQPTTTISARRAGTLLAEVRDVLLRALAEGGTSFDAQYVNVNGASGYFSRSLHAYGRTGEPCDRCGTPIVREAFMNRSSHYCPRCQRVR